MLVLRRALYVITFSVVGFAALPAMAQFTVCNESAEFAYVAVGYWDPDYGEYVSQGWMYLDPGQCDVAYEGDLQYQFYYVYAETEPDKAGNVGFWGGDTLLCVNGSNDFIIYGNVNCDVGFSEVDTGKSRDWQYNLQ
jgi:uncharacterized membrane protein